MPSMVVAVAESEVAARRVVPVTASGQATITIPAAGVSGLSVVRYVGSPDDAHGTTFEERGLAASPTGPGGGVDPGQVGNSIVTAHRTSAGGPFLRVPELRSGDRVEVTWGGRTFVYAVVGRFLVTFHDPASYARQVSVVPGFPGQRATHAMLTLSTCATPEDNAAGLHERDALGNPPHRIDIVAQLVAVR
jgi:sortase A